MFYRRKILLTLLETFNNRMSIIELQKYLFLATVSDNNPAYEFVPHKSGCYSFTALSDLNALCENGLVEMDNNNINRITNDSFAKDLSQDDLNRINNAKETGSEFKNIRDLMHHVFSYAPYYALNSTVKESYLPAKKIEEIKKTRLIKSGQLLSTIGYEGISIEAYINRLLKNNIRCLVDVRKSPRSMKFGFTKSRLEQICIDTGIIYISIPELGIDAEKRNNLSDEKSYTNLFESYTDKTLSKTVSQQKKILDLINKHKRVSLTCFEADINKCHRKTLAEFLLNKYHPVESILHL